MSLMRNLVSGPLALGNCSPAHSSFGAGTVYDAVGRASLSERQTTLPVANSRLASLISTM